MADDVMPQYEPQPQAFIEATRDEHIEYCGEGCPIIDMLNELLALRQRAARLEALVQAAWAFIEAPPSSVLEVARYRVLSEAAAALAPPRGGA